MSKYLLLGFLVGGLGAWTYEMYTSETPQIVGDRPDHPKPHKPEPHWPWPHPEPYYYFRVGERVQLNSGGPVMTVFQTEPGEYQHVICEWFTEAGVRQEYMFRAYDLHRIE